MSSSPCKSSDATRGEASLTRHVGARHDAGAAIKHHGKDGGKGHHCLCCVIDYVAPCSDTEMTAQRTTDTLLCFMLHFCIQTELSGEHREWTTAEVSLYEYFLKLGIKYL